MLLFSQSTLEREPSSLSISADRARNQHCALFHLRQKPDTERVKRASVCPVWEGFLTCTMCHIFHILIVKFAAIARCSHHENQDDWEALCRASAVLLMEMFLKRRPLASLPGFTKRIFGWWAEGFCSWRDNCVGSDLSNVLNSICYLTLKSGTRRTSAPFALQRSKICPARRSSWFAARSTRWHTMFTSDWTLALKLPIFSVVGSFFS